MILLDTHAWIWWAAGAPGLSKKAAKAIDDATALGVSAISCWEVAMLSAKGRLVLDRDPEAWLDLALKLPRTRLLALSPRIAVRSTRLEGGSLTDPAGCVIAATALEHGCTIVSKDERIRRHPSLRSVW